MIPNQFPFFQFYNIPQAFQYQPSFEYLPFNFPCFLPVGNYMQEESYSPQEREKYVELRTDDNSLVENLQKEQETQKVVVAKKTFRTFKKVALVQQTNGKKEAKGANEASQQKEGRNANSNLLRMFFRRLQMKIEKEAEKFQAIIKKHALSFTIPQFQEWLARHSIDYRNYIRVSSVKKLFRNHQASREFSLALRVMLQAFINEESLCCYLTSRKLKKQLMPHSLRSIRNIYSELFAELEQE